MSEWLPQSSFVEYGLQAYLSRFEVLQKSTDCSTLKLESAQHFVEPGNESWELFKLGRWEEALHEAGGMVKGISDSFANLADRNITTRRIRLTEQPVSPYLQWELHILRLRAEAGEDIRTLPNGIAAIHLGFQPRELVFMGEISMFDIIYSNSGVLQGAREFAWDVQVDACKASVEDLFHRAEPLALYFDKVVKHLPAPYSR